MLPKSFIEMQSTSQIKEGKTRLYLPSIMKSSTKDLILTRKTLEKMTIFSRQEFANFEKKCEIVNRMDTKFLDDEFGDDYNLTSNNDFKESQYKSEISN